MKNFTIFISCILMTACVSSTSPTLKNNNVVDEQNQTQVINESYRLASGDRIKINVFNEAELSLEISISTSGIINYPHLNEIKLSGLTVNEVEALITKGLQDGILKEPMVRVSIVDYRPFFIDGEIQSSGGYPFQPGLTVRKAISIAGGLSERASENKIYIIRATNVAQGKIKVTLDDYIYPGDVLTIGQGFF